MENRIIDWIEAHITAMTREGIKEFKEFLHKLELESFAKDRQYKWGE